MMRLQRSRLRWTAIAAALPLLAALPAAGGAPDIDYMVQCQGCHLADGTGSPGSVPSLAGEIGRFLAVPGGRAYLVRVPGSATSPLSDEGLASVLNWMIRRFGPEEIARDFRPYDADEVARWRSDPLVDVDGTRRRLRAAMAERRGAASTAGTTARH